MAKIYHYTTIDTLALIMLNRTIRFNRLDRVDDREEALWGSGPLDLKVSRNVFVSCWTRNPNENPDLWHRYTKGNKGVRIALEEDMFEKYQSQFYFPVLYKTIGDCIFPFPLNTVKLYDVQYVENNEECIRRTGSYKDDYINIMTQDLGIYKKKNEWAQQEECRFKLLAFPTTPEASANINSESVNQMFAAMETFKSLLLKNHQITLEYYDMPLKKGVLDSIQVTMGPETTKEDKAKVHRILYPCPVCRLFSKRKIIDSCLKN